MKNTSFTSFKTTNNLFKKEVVVTVRGEYASKWEAVLSQLGFHKIPTDMPFPSAEVCIIRSRKGLIDQDGTVILKGSRVVESYPSARLGAEDIAWVVERDFWLRNYFRGKKF